MVGAGASAPGREAHADRLTAAGRRRTHPHVFPRDAACESAARAPAGRTSPARSRRSPGWSWSPIALDPRRMTLWRRCPRAAESEVEPKRDVAAAVRSCAFR